jgi:zinc protease
MKSSPRNSYLFRKRSNTAYGGDPFEALPGIDDITRVELPNGITILARPNFNSPSVFLQGYLQAGSLTEPNDKLGLAAFTASSLMRGASQRSFQEIYEALEAVGASLGFDGGTHTTTFGGRTLVEDLDLLLHLLSDSLLHPTFPIDHIEKLRAHYLTALALRAQDTGEMASFKFDEIVYAGHPYSRPDDGTPETIRSIQREDMVSFHQNHFGPKGMVVVVVGGLEPSEAVEKVAAVLGDWHNPGQILPPALPPVLPIEQVVRGHAYIPGKSQADLVIGSVGPTRLSPDFLAASLGNNIFGQFGMYGRIGESVRERAGLAYYAYSSLSGGTGPGPWYISAGVAPHNVEKTIDLLLQEVALFVSEGVTEEELSDSKANYIGRLPLSMETNAGVASALVSLERYQLGLDYYRRYPGLVSAITKEQVLEAARKYLDPQRIAVSTAGSLDAPTGMA